MLKKNLSEGPAPKNTSVFLSSPFTTAFGGGKEEEGRDSEAALSVRKERRRRKRRIEVAAWGEARTGARAYDGGLESELRGAVAMHKKRDERSKHRF